MSRDTHTLRSKLRALWGDRRFRAAKWTLIILVVIGLLGDFLANDKPLYCSIEGNVDSPAIRHLLSHVGLASWTLADAAGDWKNRAYDRVIFAPIPYAPENVDLQNANFRGPFDKQQVRSTRYRHWLGTDHLGRDVFAGLIYGTRVALLVGLCSMLLAAFIGIPIGAMAGYLGDEKFRIGIAGLLTALAGGFIALFFLITALALQARPPSSAGSRLHVWLHLYTSSRKF